MDQVMYPPPEADSVLYWYERVPAGDCRVRLDWVKYTVRAIVDREPTIFQGRSQNPVDAYQLVVRKWSIKRGWVYKILDVIEFSSAVEYGQVQIVDKKPRGEPVRRSA